MRGVVLVAGVAVLALIGFGAWWMYWPHQMDGASAGGPMVDVVVPDLSAQARRGEAVFNENCATCHGRNAAGSDQGPPLVHRIYEPSHHGDSAFYRAVGLGVRAHHWRFGDMAAVDGVTERDVAHIVRYIRELQRANGIF